MLAEKHFAAKSVWLDQRDYRVLKKIAKKTRVSVAHFIREGLRMVIAKYAAFAEDDPELNLELYIAAPAHAELLEQRRSMKDTIQPHEGLTNPIAAEADRKTLEESCPRHTEPPPTSPSPPTRHVDS